MKAIFSIILALLIIPAFFVITGYNKIQKLDEQCKSAWSEVLNQFQRRADLIPNLVNTVKGYAKHESDVFTKVTEARAKVNTTNISLSDTTDPEKLKSFLTAQDDVKSSLSRLIAVSENYPQLKADTNFRDLQAQLEGTENRITIARRRFIESIQEFNVQVRSFPGNLIAKFFGYSSLKEPFKVENEKEISVPVKVEF